MMDSSPSSDTSAGPLDPTPLLVAEFNYIAQSAFQANEDRARVSSYSRRRRRQFVDETWNLIDTLSGALDPTSPDTSSSALVPAAAVDGALALLGGARVLVLGSAHRASGSNGGHAVALAETLAWWDVSVVVLDKEMELADE